MKQAVKNLKWFLLNRDYVFTIHLEDKPCDNYAIWTTKWVDRVNNIMKIFIGGSNHTIYDEDSMGATLNILARAWHDEYHYLADLDFSYRGEMKVQELQWYELKRARVTEEAQLLFLIDMVGQTTYYQKTDKFLDRQCYTVDLWFSEYKSKYGISLQGLNFETIRQRIKDIVWDS
jgi:hypothetical protein